MAKTDEEAVDMQWPYWAEAMEASSRERGWARPSMNKFRAEITGGSRHVGSPETVASKLAAAIRLLGLGRLDLAYAVGRVPHEQRMATIELYRREAIPRLREVIPRLREVIPRLRELLAAARGDVDAT
ncbi:hypothetical protein FXW78_54055 [Rhodococcus opacus]|nr:hypothetical protein [Rhodococcus opacus]